MRSPHIVAAAVLAVSGVAVAPTAAADCTTAGNTTICSVGGVDGSGPYVPYPCQYDYYCDDSYGWQFDLDADPGPGAGLPGRPGNRPGGGGGGGGGGRPGR